MDSIEQRVGLYFDEIKNCVKHPTVASHLHASGIITHEQQSQLLDYYRQDKIKATEELIQCVRASQEPGKWTAFYNALVKGEYPYLSVLLNPTTCIEKTSKREKNMIRVFLPALGDTITAREIAPHLYSKHLIDKTDMQEILSVYDTHGNTYASICLLERMQTRQPPKVWYYEFLSTLIDTKNEAIVEEIEPDFIKNQKQFDPKYGQDREEFSSADQTFTNKDDVKEHVLMDYEEASTSTNLNASPSHLGQFVLSSDADDDGGSSSNQFNKKEFVKPKIPRATSTVPVPVVTAIQSTLSSIAMAYNGDTRECTSKGTKDVTENYVLTVKKIPTDQELVEIAHCIEQGWEFLAAYLSVDNGIVQAIKADTSIHLHAYNMLLKWRDSRGNNATLENLILKMRKAKGVTIDWKALNEGLETVAKKENNDQCDSGSSDDNYMGSDDEEAETNSGCDTYSDFKLRDYQLELAKHALQGTNTVICAVTGSGKTWVALHIVNEHLKGAPRGERKVAFMARTGILIQQQSSRFDKYLPDFNTKLLSAEDENTKFLDSFLEYYDIFCFTPQILVNSLQNMSVKSISQFSLLILDECHHTAGEEPYNNLMRRYLKEKIDGATKLPQIIGLTATFGVGKSRTDQEAVDYILHLCARMDIRIISTVDKSIESLRKYTSTPSEEVILLDNQESDPCKRILVQAIEETERKLEDITLLQCKMIDVMKKMPRNKESKEYVKWVNEVKMKAQRDMDFTNSSRDIIACATYLNGYSEAIEMNKLLHADDVIRHLAQKFGADAEQLQALTKVENELLQSLKAKQKELIKVRSERENRNIFILRDTLRKEFIDKGEDSRAMVFVKARATCQALADFLNQDLEDITVRVHSFYGQSTIGNCKGMTDKEQIELTERFREGYYKILVATSVGIEGIDVPDCNIILSYDYAGNELMKTQMKGRCRKAGGKAITMGSKKDKDQEVVNAYKAAMMQRAVKQFQALDRNKANFKILSYQREELHKYNSRVEMEGAKLMKKTTDEYELRCIRCDSFACYVKDLIKYLHHHIVTEKKFDERIKKVLHTDQKLFDGIQKRYKMFCKDCPVPWGAVGYLHNIEVKILKLESFKCKCLDTGVISVYKKWKDTPFYVKEVKEADLHKYIKPGSGDVS